MIRFSIPPHPASRRRVLRLLGAGTALPLVGCGGILPRPAPPPRLFLLRAPARYASLPPVDVSTRRLLIAVPDAAYGLATQRIVLTRGAYGLDYFADAAWQDKMPAMVQSLLVESFENAGRLAAVGRGVVPWSADFTLQSNILDFEAAYDAAMDAPRVKLRFNLTLVRNRDRSVVAHTDLTETAQARRNAIDAVVAGFDQAFQALAPRLVSWTLAVMASA
ncbi:MAG TPA: ABC-type transport auxiliary lipoprotein family protein [Stellaceae bacterium]|jgi:cholesterol transport system auxiliary component|nr:ABC-type transport auxiliary lipoprotein family protein [Stellaceae bacterium]